MNLIFTIYILFFLWLIHIIQRIFYSIYFWQLKEYRFDRITADLKISFKAFLPKTAIIATIISLVCLPFFLYYKNVPLWNSFVLVIFYLFGIHSIFILFKKRWKTPKFTKKAIFLVFLSIVISMYCAFIFIFNFFIFIVFAEIFLSLATFLIVEIMQAPTFFIKRIIYKKAKDKIENHKNLTVVAINGSYGKSSTKEFIYTILSKKYKVLKTSGNINTEIGVAQTILNDLKPEHQIFIVEMGAYRKGEIKLMCEISHPKIGIVTGINEQHIALFGSFKNLLLAEGGGELAETLPKDGILIVNGDNKYCLGLYKKFNGIKKIYSLSNKLINSDIWADEITVHKDYISFVSIDRTKEMMHFNAKVLGKHNIQNLLGAILIAKELGMNFGEISEACRDILEEQGGMVLKQGKHGIDVIDSSYSANPDGVFADLDYLSILEGKKVVVMPCLIELGEKSSEIHKKIGRKIASICDLAIITTEDKFNEIKKSAMENGMMEKNILLCDNPQEIYLAATLFCKSGDTVLLEGRVPKGLLDLLIK
ncbi:MAG: UDP-N-acetylmuramoyl-tripeptide--D-alanyl-D-alanine ligase [Candidatus Staskawiczbacteria bacterium]|nr:UDP-N-acetylmuramoyl-tripeptide--D-alanyl-D-alanine ligase [Candidatus Staskawiczbacteria bacterium]